MADFQPGEGEPAIINSKMTGSVESIDPDSHISRAKRKLVRSGSRSWFNKSLDQTVVKPAQTRTIRRQKSVTDFFQNMLIKGKSHLQDIFNSKKDKTKKYTATAVGGIKKHSPGSELTTDKMLDNGAVGGLDHNAGQSLNPDSRCNPFHNSCPNFFDKEELLTYPLILKPHGSFNSEANARTGNKQRSTTNGKKLIAPADFSATAKMFMINGPDNFRVKPEWSRLNRSNTMHCRVNASIVYPSEKQFIQLEHFHEDRLLTPVMAFPSPCGTMHTLEKGPVFRRKLSNISSSKQSIYSEFSSSPADDISGKGERKLVKSNSDTFAALRSFQETLSKASSDGNCFKTSIASSLASSMTSIENIMVGITDYLFLGSIEAAYNEPLLCKYNISSLVDMTNVSPTLIPPNKKSDCPCACTSKSHFRSKLNIGVDDIEWEDLEQYFDDINAFINGARKKQRRVLVFSYMGQSRAAAAVIQHIMQHYNISYQKALDIVRARRPQTKLNSGFVKSLLRLEKRLVLEDSDKNTRMFESLGPDISLNVSTGSMEALKIISAPPVVRGAWLEC
ncbi:unnamed protein product [Candidula unifasciata]|uniref:protein-tyrosine-phosphatase n=1 Tax=Candidula unifasciata TaxID=100452 RepID=A0A8S3YP95_9EUPU|nr:unnamed protein product [Candidula unifasciata]